MTDLERPSRHSTAWSGRRFRLFRRVGLPALAVVMVPVFSMVSVARPAGADQLSSAKAKAAQIEQQIQSTGQQIGALDQQYQGAQDQKAALDHQISSTQDRIATTERRIKKDRSTLRAAAVKAYVSDGLAASENALFSGNQTTAGAARVYRNVLSGDLSSAVADLNTARSQLDQQRAVLRGEDAQAAQAVATAHTAFQRAQALEAQQQQALDQVKGQIATLIQQQQASAQRAAQQAAQAKLAAAQAAARSRAAAASVAITGSSSSSSSPPSPPPASGNAGTIAVRAAESQLGVPYVWGGETPGVGFDCSGLTAWAWGQAGVSLPHFSGAQMADSVPVPVSDLQPGDLLFYGPGGSQHVAMYVGGGQMIEAPFTGTVVRIDPVRLGAGFAGAGRP